MTTPYDEEFTKAFHSGQDFAVALAKILKLPKHMCRLEIVITHDQPVVIKCEYYDYLSDFNKVDLPIIFDEFEVRRKENIMNFSQQNQQQTYSQEELFLQEWRQKKFLIEQDEPASVKKLRAFLSVFQALKHKLMHPLRRGKH